MKDGAEGAQGNERTLWEEVEFRAQAEREGVGADAYAGLVVGGQGLSW